MDYENVMKIMKRFRVVLIQLRVTLKDIHMYAYVYMVNWPKWELNYDYRGS